MIIKAIVQLSPFVRDAQPNRKGWGGPGQPVIELIRPRAMGNLESTT